MPVAILPTTGSSFGSKSGSLSKSGAWTLISTSRTSTTVKTSITRFGKTESRRGCIIFLSAPLSASRPDFSRARGKRKDLGSSMPENRRSSKESLFRRSLSKSEDDPIPVFLFGQDTERCREKRRPEYFLKINRSPAERYDRHGAKRLALPVVKATSFLK